MHARQFEAFCHKIGNLNFVFDEQYFHAGIVAYSQKANIKASDP
jgi:hypothetical protein